MLASGVYRHRGFLGLVLVAAGLAGAQDPGGSLLERMLDAHGGLERFQSLTRWRIVAERNLFGGDGPEHETYEELLRHDDSLVMTLLVKRRENELLVFGHDGTKGFSIADGRLRDDAEAEGEGYYRAHGEYYLRSIPFKWTDPGVSVRYLGPEGPDLELLEIRAEEGVGRDYDDIWVAAVDSETHLLREARLTHRGSREIVYRYSDYRDVGGMLFPFRLEYLVDGARTGENLIRSFDIDADVAEELFAPEHWRRP